MSMPPLIAMRVQPERMHAGESSVPCCPAFVHYANRVSHRPAFNSRTLLFFSCTAMNP